MGALTLGGINIDNTYRNCCEINLSALKHNFNQIKNYIGSNVAIMGVVKADAYGHGVTKVAEALVETGVDYFAVACIEEALELRGKFSTPILVLGYIPYDKIRTAIENDITLTVYSKEVARDISSCAEQFNIKAKVHIKIDTGMNRLGFQSCQLDEVHNFITQSSFNVEGIYTHFSCAGTDHDYTREQFQEFNKICEELSKLIHIKYIHCCNSSGIINYPNMHMNMVRPGLLLYGIYPDDSCRILEILPVMSLKARVIHLKDTICGAKIGYGAAYTCERKTKVATVSLGYADGLPRLLSNKGSVVVNGKKARIIGNICMDQCMVDVTEIEDIRLGDTVMVFGSNHDCATSVDEVALKTETISYEILCGISKRVPKVYI